MQGQGIFSWGSSQYGGAKKAFDAYFEAKNRGKSQKDAVEQLGYVFTTGGNKSFNGDAFLDRMKKESRDLWSVSGNLLNKCFKTPLLKPSANHVEKVNEVTGLIAALTLESGCVRKEDSFKDFDT